MAMRYTVEFVWGGDDPDEFDPFDQTDAEFPTLQEAKSHAEANLHLDRAGGPRIRVEEFREYPADARHCAAEEWAETEYLEYDSGAWSSIFADT